MCANITYCLAILFSRHGIQHDWKDAVSAETLVGRDTVYATTLGDFIFRFNQMDQSNGLSKTLN